MADAAWQTFHLKMIPQVTTPKWNSVLFHDAPQGVFELLYGLTVGFSCFIGLAIITSFGKIIFIVVGKLYITQHVERAGTPRQLLLYAKLHGPRQFSSGRSSMHLVAQKTNHEGKHFPAGLAEALLDLGEGEALDIKDDHETTPLMVACAKGNHEFVQWVHDHRKDILAKATEAPHGEDGYYLLGHAARLLHPGLCKLLMESNADPRLGKSKPKLTSALMLAIDALATGGWQGFSEDTKDCVVCLKGGRQLQADDIDQPRRPPETNSQAWRFFQDSRTFTAAERQLLFGVQFHTWHPNLHQGIMPQSPPRAPAGMPQSHPSARLALPAAQPSPSGQ